MMVADPVETRRGRVAAEDDWGRWGQNIADRIADLEVKTTAWLGVDSRISDADPPAILEFIDDAARSERKERAAAIAKLADAWTERLSAEIAVLDERLGQKLDSTVFDLASLRQFKASLEKGARELRMDIARETEVIDARLSAQADRLNEASRLTKALSVRVASLEKKLRGLPAPPVTIASWQVEPQTYVATPIMSDGSTGAPLPLRSLFEQYFEDAKT
jgi:hypothetical protein